MRNILSKIVLTLTCVMSSLNCWASDLVNNNAVILLYHHVSETTPKVTSVSPNTFRQHMQYLADNHSVLPLQKVIETLRDNKPLPDKTVVITFDDGYQNIYQNAHPILLEFDFPYTVFINPPLIGKIAYQLTWQQVKEMQEGKASFANHGSEHSHMLARHPEESEANWLKRTIEGVQRAEKMLSSNVNHDLKYFAYPYGEFNAILKQELHRLGYVGFAQHSGAIASHSDFSALPRFPAAGLYSNLKTLKVKLNSLAMPVTQVYPENPQFTVFDKTPEFTFRVDTGDIRLGQMSCFQNGERLTLIVNEDRVNVGLNSIQRAGRHRVNCTAPSIKSKGRYYWFSQPFFVSGAKGEWPD